jgi:hypothetical protein
MRSGRKNKPVSNRGEGELDLVPGDLEKKARRFMPGFFVWEKWRSTP